MEFETQILLSSVVLLFLSVDPSLATYLNWNVIRPEVWDYSKHDFKLINGQFSSHLQMSKSATTIQPQEPIPNLNRYLQAFQPNCLIHLINYNGRDFLPFPYPVVLSRYDVAHLFYQRLSRETGKLAGLSIRKRFFFPEHFQKLNLTWCRRYFPDMECLDLPYHDKTSSSKWTCEAHLYLDPPTPHRDPLFFTLDPHYNRKRLDVPGSFKRFWTNGIISKVLLKHNDDDGYKKYHGMLSEYQVLMITRPKYQVLVSDGA